MSAKKRKTFQYKEVRITNTTDTLQAMLERFVLKCSFKLTLLMCLILFGYCYDRRRLCPSMPVVN